MVIDVRRRALVSVAVLHWKPAWLEVESWRLREYSSVSFFFSSWKVLCLLLSATPGVLYIYICYEFLLWNGDHVSWEKVKEGSPFQKVSSQMFGCRLNIERLLLKWRNPSAFWLKLCQFWSNFLLWRHASCHCDVTFLEFHAKKPEAIVCRDYFFPPHCSPPRRIFSKVLSCEVLTLGGNSSCLLPLVLTRVSTK